MNRPCVICKRIIIVKSLKTKYCGVCSLATKRVKARDWKRLHTTRKDFDLFCLECNVSLPIGSKGDKLYCVICARNRIKKQYSKYNKQKILRNKLNKFYKNIQFNIIQSPYFVDRKKVEILA